MKNQTNPYDSPSGEIIPDSDFSETSTRNTYIRHEKSIKTIGYVMFFAGFSLVGLGGKSLYSGQDFSANIYTILIGVGFSILSIGVCKLNKLAQIVTGVFSLLAVCTFPYTVLVFAYVLYAFFCDFGRKVFSKGYKDIIKATPKIESKPSILFVLVLVSPLLYIMYVYFFY